MYKLKNYILVNISPHIGQTPLAKIPQMMLAV